MGRGRARPSDLPLYKAEAPVAERTVGASPLVAPIAINSLPFERSTAFSTMLLPLRKAAPALLALLTLLASSAPGPAGTGTPDDGSELVFLPLADGFSNPTSIGIPNDGSGWIFVGEQFGRVMIYRDGFRSAEPFLDLRDRVYCCGEAGLLDVVFHPNYAENGYVYVSFTELGPLRNVVARYTVSADSARLDPDSERIVLEVEQPHPTHNSGRMAFGPDGLLYIGIGDGGPLDFEESLVAQDPHSLLGKLLRIDVNVDEDAGAGGGLGPRYAIPPGNPFADGVDGAPEVFAMGLRNPWRFSFDRLTGDLYVGDVGAALFEEINVIPAGAEAPLNFGWPLWEAHVCTLLDPDCPDPGFLQPLFAIPHQGAPCRAVTGGFRYRGAAMPQLFGRYLFADWCTEELWTAKQADEDGWELGEPSITGFGISSFGQDPAGELYAVDHRQGVLYRLQTAWPQPQLTDVSPKIAAAAGREFTAALAGQGFVPGTEVWLDGERLESEYRGAGRLLASMPRNLDPGVRTLQVRNPEPNPGPSETLEIEIRAGTATPEFTSEGVVNGASFQTGPIAPGGIVSLFGENLAIDSEAASVTPLSDSLGGAVVEVLGVGPAPLLFASPGQINFIAPWALPRTARLRVQVGDQPSRVVNNSTADAAPAVFLLEGGRAAALIAGTGSLAASTEEFPGSHPISRGEYLQLYVAGLGLVDPEIDLGAPAVGLHTALEPPTVWFGDIPVQPAFAGLAPGFVGLYQINVLVPQNAPLGESSPVRVTAGGERSNAATIAIR